MTDLGEQRVEEKAPSASTKRPGPPFSPRRRSSRGWRRKKGWTEAAARGTTGVAGDGRWAAERACGGASRGAGGEAAGWEARSQRRRPEPRARAAASAERAARVTWCACRRSRRAHNGAFGVCAERLPDAGGSWLLRLQRLHASPPGGFPEPAGRPGGRGRVR